MFKSFRWYVLMWFLGLSFVLYVVLSLIGGLYLYTKLSYATDEELKVVASHIGHAIDLRGNKPTFRDWLRVVQTEPDSSIISMQLFDASGRLLEHYGPIRIPKLISGTSEISENGHTVRVRLSPLHHKGVLVGYLQLQLPTTRRTELAKEYFLSRAAMSLFVLAVLGVSGYIVSGIAVKPIERLVSTLQGFIADAGHELNTPSSIIQARAQSLERKLSRDRRFQDDVKIIASSAERMGCIVKNLMLLAELDSSNYLSQKTPVDLRQLIQLVENEFKERFEEQNITLSCGKIDQTIILADTESIRCILGNLLENALRYTESGGYVTLSCRYLGNEICLTVEDTGLGIPKDCLPRVFDRFFRVDRSRSRASGGTGLGLSIVKAIVENLNGKVEVESQLGKGSRFHVWLPTYSGFASAQHLLMNSERLY